jgi:hypothetical protein
METGYDVEGDITTVTVTRDGVPTLKFRVVVEGDSGGVVWEFGGSRRKATPITG